MTKRSNIRANTGGQIIEGANKLKAYSIDR